jgi:hypothetical protein
MKAPVAELTAVPGAAAAMVVWAARFWATAVPVAAVVPEAREEAAALEVPALPAARRTSTASTVEAGATEVTAAPVAAAVPVARPAGPA